MGNQLLTKTVVGALLILGTSHAEITINDIDKLVNDIKEERVGLSKTEIVNAKDPFVYYSKGAKPIISSTTPTRKIKRRFYLSAIVNDRVKINNRWYALNGIIHGYKIKKVGKNYVLLTRNNSQIRVYMKKPKSKKIKLIAK